MSFDADTHLAALGRFYIEVDGTRYYADGAPRWRRIERLARRTLRASEARRRVLYARVLREFFPFRVSYLWRPERDVVARLAAAGPDVLTIAALGALRYTSGHLTPDESA